MAPKLSTGMPRKESRYGLTYYDAPCKVGAMNESEAEALRVAVTALKWYADPANWFKDDWNVMGVVNPPDYGKPGHKARNALKSIEILTKGTNA